MHVCVCVCIDRVSCVCRSCPSVCSAHGTCEFGFCICQDGWLGELCDEKVLASFLFCPPPPNTQAEGGARVCGGGGWPPPSLCLSHVRNSKTCFYHLSQLPYLLPGNPSLHPNSVRPSVRPSLPSSPSLPLFLTLPPSSSLPPPGVPELPLLPRLLEPPAGVYPL